MLSAEILLRLNFEADPRIYRCGRGDPFMNVSVQKGHHTIMLKMNQRYSNVV